MCKCLYPVDFCSDMANTGFSHNMTVENSPYRLETDQVTLIKEVTL